MNREEAIEYGTEWLKDEYLDAKDRAFIKIALEALEQEPKTGHWIRQDNTKKPLYGWYFCSECNSVIGDKTKFCSNCGARMAESER